MLLLLLLLLLLPLLLLVLVVVVLRIECYASRALCPVVCVYLPFAPLPFLYSGQPLVILMLTYAVVAVQPGLADTAGGTPLIVQGLGFTNTTQMTCVFPGAQHVPGTFLSSTQVLCMAPTADVSSSCEGDPLELALMPWQVWGRRRG